MIGIILKSRYAIGIWLILPFLRLPGVNYLYLNVNRRSLRCRDDLHLSSPARLPIRITSSTMMGIWTPELSVGVPTYL